MIIIALGILLLACSPGIFALDPSVDVNQYAHTAWKLSEGFYKGVTWSIAQTPDGYLWLGTEFGLLRFDGVRTVAWQPPAGERLPSTDVKIVRATRDGGLLIGTSGGLVSWKNGKLTHYPAFDGLIIEAALEDREGTIWVVAGWVLPKARLCSIKAEKANCYGEDGGPGSGITTIYEDSQGNLWAGGMKGIWRWQPGSPKLYAMAGPAQRTYALTESDDGGILICRRSGITELRDGKFEPYPFPAGLQFGPGTMLRDRDGGLWIGALVDQGLLHIHQGKVDRFTPADGASGDLSGDAVECLFEDREGSIWVSTRGGLDRFREFAAATFSVQQGLSSRGAFSVLAGKDNSVWLGTSDGLNRWNRGQIEIYRKRAVRVGTPVGGPTAGQLAEPGAKVREIFNAGLPHDELMSLFEEDNGQVWVSTLGGVAFLKSERFVPVRFVPPGNVFSITGDHTGNVWMSHDEGLFHLQHARPVERIPWAKLGRKEAASALLHDTVQGGLWLGFRDGGVAFFRDGQLRASYAGDQGLAGAVHSFYEDGSGVLWAATADGLSRIKDHRVLTLTSEKGLPCNNVHWMTEDDVHSVWVYTACGLVRMARSDLDAWVSNSKQITQLTVFDSSDGVRNHPNISRDSPIVAKATDGKVWFLNSTGVSVIDPHRLPYNNLPPPVHIEQITADGKTYDVLNGLRLPPRIRNLTIDYTALSLVDPNRVRFRYLLEGQDAEWREVINDRRVEYTNLPPRTYHFRIKACNNSGVWNETGDILEFSIAPAWNQTAWFYGSCAGGFLALVWVLYRLRLYQITREFNAQLDGRVDERLRVARDLHDTMLQSFQAGLIQMQAGYNILSRRPEKAAEAIREAITTSADAIAEGRAAIQNMRSSTVQTNDLARALRIAGDRMALEGPARFDVRVQGSSRDVHPILRDEVYRIALEAMRNAFKHSDATAIEAEIVYGDSLNVRIRDDGKGIDPAIMKDGRLGHYGIAGMRERAKQIGGRLDVWSGPGAGTEIQLKIPGAIAFGSSAVASLFKRFGRRHLTNKRGK